MYKMCTYYKYGYSKAGIANSVNINNTKKNFIICLNCVYLCQFDRMFISIMWQVM